MRYALLYLLAFHIMFASGCVLSNSILDAGKRTEYVGKYNRALLLPESKIVIAYYADITSDSLRGDFDREDRWAIFDLTKEPQAHIETHNGELPDRIVRQGAPLKLFYGQDNKDNQLHNIAKDKSLEDILREAGESGHHDNFLIARSNDQLYYVDHEPRNITPLPSIHTKFYRLWWGYPALVLLPVAAIGDIIAFPFQLSAIEPSVAR